MTYNVLEFYAGSVLRTTAFIKLKDLRKPSVKVARAAMRSSPGDPLELRKPCSQRDDRHLTDAGHLTCKLNYMFFSKNMPYSKYYLLISGRKNDCLTFGSSWLLKSPASAALA
ncbi:MAG: hypothetical protein KDE50_16295 [Caldilineaceae bacterium]|nr:hypothetical protein [Caldilineaceae bacterium]